MSGDARRGGDPRTVGQGVPFSRAELEAALRPHMGAEEAASEAAAIATAARDAGVTGATLGPDALAMLHALSPELARRVDDYREAVWARRREAWLRRETRTLEGRGGVPGTVAVGGGRAGERGEGAESAGDARGDADAVARLEAHWEAYRAGEEEAWRTLVRRVRAAVGDAAERGGVGGPVGSPGGDLVRLTARRRDDE